MTKNFFAADIGNTNITFGVFDRNKITHELRINSRIENPEKNIQIQLENFLVKEKLTGIEFYGSGISSVVPRLTEPVKNCIKKILNNESFEISDKIKLGISLAKVDAPAMGADRLCVSVAAFLKYGGPIIVLDFGTATTFDVISSGGQYLGGLILPGIELSANALHEKTAKLPKIQLKFPQKVLGKNTISNIQSGIMFGSLCAVEGLIKLVKKEMHSNAKVIATGGLSKIIHKKSKLIDFCEPRLILHGIKTIYEMNNP